MQDYFFHFTISLAPNIPFYILSLCWKIDIMDRSWAATLDDEATFVCIFVGLVLGCFCATRRVLRTTSCLRDNSRCCLKEFVLTGIKIGPLSSTEHTQAIK